MKRKKSPPLRAAISHLLQTGQTAHALPESKRREQARLNRKMDNNIDMRAEDHRTREWLRGIFPTLWIVAPQVAIKG